MELNTNQQDIEFRHGRRADIPEIVRLLADDPLGSLREKFDAEPSSEYFNAFEEIQADHNNELIVLETDEQVIGTLQITYIPSLTYQGGKEHKSKAFALTKACADKELVS